MGATFIVTLREAFEAALLLGIVYTYLDKLGGRRLHRYATAGAALGVLASVGLGVTVTFASGPLLDVGPDVLTTAVLFAAVGLLTWHGWWMRRHARAIKGDVQRRIDAASASRRVWTIGLIAFTGVFREGAETVLFLWGLLTQVADGWGGVLGGALGLTVACGLGWALFRGGARLSLPRFFAVTSVLLLLIAAGLFATGVGKLQGLGVLPPSPAAWDTSAVLGDDGVLGGFLGGVVGYRARPTVLEVGAWTAYVIVAGALLFGPVLHRVRPEPRAVPSTGAAP